MKVAILKTLYPSFRMDEVCRLCCGNPQKNLGIHRCKICKRCLQDYRNMDLDREVQEFAWLKECWLKAKQFNQRTTGIQKLDFAMTVIYGPPHNNGWRKAKPKVTSPHVVLRLIGDVA